jgi:ActR/RegA family two-component response regulator
MEVVIVDEEFNFAENVASILRIEGYETVVLTDATEALAYLRAKKGMSGAYILLVDVSLAPGDDVELFSAEETNEYMETGLVLVGKLGDEGTLPQQARRVVIYTAHYTTELWTTVKAFCGKGSFGYWQKRPNADPRDIVERVAKCAI